MMVWSVSVFNILWNAFAKGPSSLFQMNRLKSCSAICLNRKKWIFLSSLLFFFLLKKGIEKRRLQQQWRFFCQSLFCLLLTFHEPGPIELAGKIPELIPIHHGLKYPITMNNHW